MNKAQAELLKFVDVEGLKGYFEKKKVKTPDDFAEQVGMNMQVMLARLAHRYHERDMSKFASTAKMSPTIKQFFAGKAFEWIKWYVIVDDVTIRGWRTELFKPKWAKNIVEPPTDRWIKKELKKIEHSPVMALYPKNPIHDSLGIISALSTEQFRKMIPKTINKRKGRYSHLRFVAPGKGGVIKVDTVAERKNWGRTATIPADPTMAYLRVFDRYVGIHVDGGQVILFDEYFFILGRN